MKSLIALIILASVSTSAFAIEPLLEPIFGQEGNGGSSVRLDIISVRNYLYANADKWKTLKDANVDIEKLRKTMDEVGTGERLIIQTTIALEDGRPRCGANHPPTKEVAFSETCWVTGGAFLPDANKALPAPIVPDFALKVGLQAHEFFGLMGLEATDRYPISSLLVEELRESKASPQPLSSGPAAKRLTYFESLLSWYEQGRPVTFAEIKGYYSGRCFRRTSMDYAQPAMLGYFDSGSGPAFGEYKMSTTFNSENADYFDDPKDAQRLIEIFFGPNDASPGLSALDESPTLHYFYWTSAENPFVEKHEFRSFNGLLIENWTAIPRTKSSKKDASHYQIMCYFFNKLRD